MTAYLSRTSSAEYWEFLFGTKNLYNGCSDSYYVRNLQHYLNICSGRTWTTITEDGSFGANTETAVRAYQAAFGLTADGIAGSATKSSLVESPD